jgi:hypothetical protein
MVVDIRYLCLCSNRHLEEAIDIYSVNNSAKSSACLLSSWESVCVWSILIGSADIVSICPVCMITLPVTQATVTPCSNVSASSIRVIISSSLSSDQIISLSDRVSFIFSHSDRKDPEVTAPELFASETVTDGVVVVENERFLILYKRLSADDLSYRRYAKNATNISHRNRIMRRIMLSIINKNNITVEITSSNISISRYNQIIYSYPNNENKSMFIIYVSNDNPLHHDRLMIIR